MLDSIHVGVTGLTGYQRGLRVIANNTANLNTPGYKGSTLEFTDLYYANATRGEASQAQLGQGLATGGTHIDFSQGDLRQTGNDLDLALQGEGLFMLRDAQGRTRYTRAGQFQWNADGVLVTRGEQAKVLGQRGDGTLGEIGNAGLRSTGGHATTTVRLTGNLSSTVETQTVGSLQVFDTGGAAHNLSLQFTSLGSERWKLELFEAGQSIGTAEVAFVDGRPTEASRRPSFNYTPSGQPAQALTLDLSSDVTSFASGTLSSLGMASQDGTGPGVLTRLAFDARGTLVASYSNGQTIDGPRLVLGRFGSDSAVETLGENQFGEANGIAWEHGLAGEPGFASVQAGSLEMSNVDLTREFSDLVVMQRGYQASSQVVSTANEMLQELFGMKNK